MVGIGMGSDFFCIRFQNGNSKKIQKLIDNGLDSMEFTLANGLDLSSSDLLIFFFLSLLINMFSKNLPRVASCIEAATRHPKRLQLHHLPT